MATQKSQPKRGARKPNPSKPKTKPVELPPRVPLGSALNLGHLMAKLGNLQVQLESAEAREAAVREQNDELRQRLVECGIAVEPTGEELAQADSIPTDSGPTSE